MRLLALATALILPALPALASPYTFVDSNYTATIYSVGDGTTVGIGFSPTGQVIMANSSVFDFLSTTADTTAYGTNTIHSITNTYTALGGNRGGYGFTYRPQDSTYYVQTGGGAIQRYDTSFNYLGTLAGTTSGYYGLHLTPQGDLVWTTAGGPVMKYSFSSGTQSQIYNSGVFNDDIAVDPSGNIFVAAYSAAAIDILDPTGALIRRLSNFGHTADGLAFGNGSIYSNNTDGTITRFDFSAPNFGGTATPVVIASGAGYGDNAAVGPDGAFYVSNACPIYADNSCGSGAYAIVRLTINGASDGGGGFSSGTTVATPEPLSAALLGSGLVAAALVRRRRG